MSGGGAEALLSDATYWRLRGRLGGWLAGRWAPLVLLALVAVCGFGLRAYRLGSPAESQPGQGFIFDERYYVNAARTIAAVPINLRDTYALQAPAGADPNGEHPQLAKAMIAISIRLLGDNPIGWRASAVVAGVAAILLLYWLVRCAGGSTWVALIAAAIAASENLWLVSARIAVLDVYCLPFMLAAAAFYLRRQPVVAGVLVGAGMCVKSFTAYVLLVLLLVEGFRAGRRLLERRLAPDGPHWTRQSLRRLGQPAALVLVAGVAYFSSLAALDTVVPPYSGGHQVDAGQDSRCGATLVWSGACNHFIFMSTYAARLRTQGAPQGIASYPWQFWTDFKPITYYKETRSVRTGNTVVISTVTDFEGVINPIVLYTGWVALLLNAFWAVRRRDDLSFLVVALAIGTWLPAEALSFFDHRITYLYYMVVTMPSIYIGVARLLAVREIPRWLAGTWGGLLLADLYVRYPFRIVLGS
jgi:hypothetical protein